MPADVRRLLPSALLDALESWPDAVYRFHPAEAREEAVSGEEAVRKARAVSGSLRALRVPRGEVLPLVGLRGPALWTTLTGSMAAGLVPCVLPPPDADVRAWLAAVESLLSRHHSAHVVFGDDAPRALPHLLEEEAEGVTVLRPGWLADADMTPAPLPRDEGGVAFLHFVAEGPRAGSVAEWRHRDVLDALDGYAASLALSPRDHVWSSVPHGRALSLTTEWLLPVLRGTSADSMPAEEWARDPVRGAARARAAGATLAFWMGPSAAGADPPAIHVGLPWGRQRTCLVPAEAIVPTADTDPR